MLRFVTFPADKLVGVVPYANLPTSVARKDQDNKFSGSLSVGHENNPLYALDVADDFGLRSSVGMPVLHFVNETGTPQVWRLGQALGDATNRKFALYNVTQGRNLISVDPDSDAIALNGVVTADGFVGDGSGLSNVASSYSLPTASTTVLGGVKVDGTTITIDGNGVISSAGGGGSMTAAEVSALFDNVNPTAANTFIVGPQSNPGSLLTVGMRSYGYSLDDSFAQVWSGFVNSQYAAEMHVHSVGADQGQVRWLIQSSGEFQVVAQANQATKYLRVTPTQVIANQFVGNGETLGLPYDISMAQEGRPSAGQKMLMMSITRDVFFPANFSGSQFFCETVPTATVVIDIKRRRAGVTTTIGQLSVSTGGVGTFTTTGGTAQDLEVGDVLYFVAPAAQDATFGDFTITVKGAA